LKTLAILSRKGGTGKTTVALHLAVQAQRMGYRTLVADADTQHSALDWFRLRTKQPPLVVEARSGALYVARDAAERSGMDLAVFDTGPSAGPDCLDAARLADLSLMVVRPSTFDLRAIRETAEAVARLGRPAWFVLNQAPSRRNGQEVETVRQAVRQLESYGFPVAPIGLRSRVAYQAGMAAGRSAMEIDPDSIASAEICALWNAVGAALWPSRPAEPARRQPIKPVFLRAIDQTDPRPTAH
jgi:chromosome partitioning protein